MSRIARSFIVIAILILTVGVTFGASPRPVPLRTRPPVLIGWACATTDVRSLALLEPEIERALTNTNAAERQGDRAVKIDLDGRDGPEVLVPLSCSPTGTCMWAIFSVRPARLRGIVQGTGLYVHASGRGWADIVAYTHMSACEGELITYRFVRGKYRSAGRGLRIRRYSDLYNVPARLRSPDLMCDVEENPSARCGPLLR